MTIQDEISEAHSFSERTMKYARNMMAVSVPILAISVFEAVQLKGSQPFNLNVTNEVWIWGFLLALMSYYFARFAPLAYLDYRFWRQMHGNYLESQRTDEKTHKETMEKHTSFLEQKLSDDSRRKREGDLAYSASQFKTAEHNIRDYIGRRRYFRLVDVCLPVGLFLWASYAATTEIVAIVF